MRLYISSSIPLIETKSFWTRKHNPLDHQNHLAHIYMQQNSNHTHWLVHSYGTVLELLAAVTRRPFWSRVFGKEAWHLLMCNFNLGMVGWALLHRLHRNSIDIRFSSSFSIAFPSLLTSSSTSTESRKKQVLKEFQCFLFFKCAELKSWLTTCRWSCRIEGSWKRNAN